MKPTLLVTLAAVLILSGCNPPGVQYSRNLFEHIPDNPQFLFLANPSDVTNLFELAIKEIDFDELFGSQLDLDTKQLDMYRGVAVEMLDILGIPVEQVESAGVLIYMGKPVFLLSGDFKADEVESKLVETGFQKRDDGFIEYVYDKQKLAIPADGVMMMAELELLEDIQDLPVERSLWNRDDFKQYRQSSPLDNSVFIWGRPPKDMLEQFTQRDELGDFSMALKFGRTITMQTVFRLNDPEKTVYLNDVIVGLVSLGKGFFGQDPDYGPVFNSLRVTQDNKQVSLSLVVPATKVEALKERIKKDFINNDTSTLDKFQQFIDAF